MNIRVLTIFPDFFSSCLGEGLLGKAAEKGLVNVAAVNLRDYATGRHRPVDDVPYGGGAGMVMKVDVWAKAIEAARRDLPGARVVLLTPQGPQLGEQTALRLARETSLVFCCGRYEGVDERVAEHLVDEWLSIGDFVLTGGEPAALVAIDAIARKLPGVIGKAESVETDTFTAGLKHPAYTRPPEFRGWRVPEVLLGGNHAAIDDWRRRESLARTARRRPDLAAGAAASRVRLAVRDPDPWLLEPLAAAGRAYGLREVVCAIADPARRREWRETAGESVKVTGPLDAALRKRSRDLLLHLADRPGPGQESPAEIAARLAAAADGATIVWGGEPPKNAVSAAPALPAEAASPLALFAWLDRLFGGR